MWGGYIYIPDISPHPGLGRFLEISRIISKIKSFSMILEISRNRSRKNLSPRADLEVSDAAFVSGSFQKRRGNYPDLRFPGSPRFQSRPLWNSLRIGKFLTSAGLGHSKSGGSCRVSDNGWLLEVREDTAAPILDPWPNIIWPWPITFRQMKKSSRISKYFIEFYQTYTIDFLYKLDGYVVTLLSISFS